MGLQVFLREVGNLSKWETWKARLAASVRSDLGLIFTLRTRIQAGFNARNAGTSALAALAVRAALACTPRRFAAGEQQVVALVERAYTVALPAAAALVGRACTAALPAAAALVERAYTAALVGWACTAAWPAAVACT